MPRSPIICARRLATMVAILRPRPMSASSSPHYKFANDQTAYRIIERVDGRPWLQSALTPHNNSSNTLTAFVQLASRGQPHEVG